jgi:hypothetical protein
MEGMHWIKNRTSPSLPLELRDLIMTLKFFSHMTFDKSLYLPPLYIGNKKISSANCLDVLRLKRGQGRVLDKVQGLPMHMMTWFRGNQSPVKIKKQWFSVNVLLLGVL